MVSFVYMKKIVLCTKTYFEIFLAVCDTESIVKWMKLFLSTYLQIWLLNTFKLLYIRWTIIIYQSSNPVCVHRLACMVIKHPPLEQQTLGLIPACAGFFCFFVFFSGSSHTTITSYLKIGTSVATLPGTWHCRVSAGTGWLGVSILWLG